MVFKCADVKAVIKKFDHFEDTLYIVSFERGTVKLNDLRQQVKSLFRSIIKWDFQRRMKNKIIQCKKCQMFGHGERSCFVNIKCANCAGKHLTNVCPDANKSRCANCDGLIACPKLYFEIRETK